MSAVPRVSPPSAAEITGPNATSIVEIRPATTSARCSTPLTSQLLQGKRCRCQISPTADAATHSATMGRPRLGPNAGVAL